MDDDGEPFSPSAFLDLPPTPSVDDVDGEDPAALPDDLVLPYISRMLMEEDIADDFFYQYPDHPALLQAQEPYAQILSDSTSDLSSDAAAGASFSSGSSDAATSNTSDGSGTFTLSPSSSDIPVFANATWPYDPLELTKLLAAGAASAAVCLSDAGEASRPEQAAGSEGEEHGVSSVLFSGQNRVMFSGQNRVNMDMVNQAFLKGMEEASKFLPDLPTSKSVLMDNVNAAQAKKKETPRMFQDEKSASNGKGRKNRNRWEEDEDETVTRSSKLMAPEPEETGDLVDKMVYEGYLMSLENMKSLRITMGTEAKNTNTTNTKKGRKGSTTEGEAVDLRTLLIHCAQAVSMDDHRSATELLQQIKRHSSPTGDANQRLSYCFAEGLEARLAGTGSQLYRTLMAKRTSVVEFLRAYQLYLAVTCFRMTAYRFSNMTITKAIAGKKKLHIVDYGVRYGCQWPNLLDYLANRKGGPPEVRMTCIELPQPGFRPTARVEETGRRLSDFARQRGLPFKFLSVTAKWETVSVDDLNIDTDEVLIVNSITHFQNIMDEGVDIYSPSPRDLVLNNIQKMRPDPFILSVVNGSYNTAFFVTRFREALFYYSAIFDMLDATAPRDNEQRLVVERDMIGRCALNVITCEGSDRVERPETYRQWQARNRQAGLRQLPLCPDIVNVLTDKVRSQYHKDFVIDTDRHWLLQGWKGRILYAMED
nr:unnamed protein product [Digitaria exilis]